MKVLLLVHEFACDGARFHGGIATYYQNMALTFKENEDDVEVVTLADENGIEIWNGITVYKVKMAPIVYRIDKILKTKTPEDLMGALLIRKRVNKLVAEWKPDIIQAANFKSVALFRRKDIPTVIRISSDSVLWRETYKCEYDYEKLFFNVRLSDYLEYLTMKRADGLFGPSNVVAEIIERRLQKHVEVIESPAVPFGDQHKKNIPPLENVEKYFLYYGSLSPMKGCLLIADVLNELMKKNEEFHFVFIGHSYGVYDEKGHKLMSVKDYILSKNKAYCERVHIYDSMSREELIPYIIYATACVFPSRIDNMPNTCLEAMQFKKVIIGTRGASFEQILKDGDSGFLINIDQKEELIEAMSKVLEMSEEQRATMGERVYQRLALNAPQLIYKKIIDFYKGVL